MASSSESPAFKYLSLERYPSSDVFVITLNKPPENRLNSLMCQEIIKAFHHVQRVLGPLSGGAVITRGSDEKFFCTGLELDESDHNPFANSDGFYPMLATILDFPYPTIALLTGHTFGGACPFALSHDYRVMNSKRGFFSMPPVDLGLHFHGIGALPRLKLRPQIARKMLLEAHRWTGEQALEDGIIDYASPPDKMFSVALDLAKKWAPKAKMGVYGLLRSELYGEAHEKIQSISYVHGRQTKHQSQAIPPPPPKFRPIMKSMRTSKQGLSLLSQTSQSKPRCPVAAQTRKQLHNSPFNFATPLSHPVVAGPPPGRPQPAPTPEEERVARKKKQAELLERGRNLRSNPSKPATVLRKRFWKEVTVKETPDGYTVYLDARPVRTSSKDVLTTPLKKPHLATAIALEWDLLVSAHQATRRHYIPLTSLTSRALDIDAADRRGDVRPRDNVLQTAMRYLSTDTLLCWAPEKNIHDIDPRQSEEGAIYQSKTAKRTSLRQQQEAAAKPIIAFLTEHIWPDVEINPVLSDDSIMPKPQPEKTTNMIRGWISGLPAWELAGLERACLASKSLIVAARLLVEWSGHYHASPWRQSQRGAVSEAQKKFGIEDAAEACSLEVRWQTDMWGEVEDTHDVEREDMKMQLGSVILLVNDEVV